MNRLAQERRPENETPGSDVDNVNSTSIRLCAASRLAGSSMLSITGIIIEERQLDFTLTQAKRPDQLACEVADS